MKKISLLALIVLVLSVLSFQTASAQLPKIKLPKPVQPPVTEVDDSLYHPGWSGTASRCRRHLRCHHSMARRQQLALMDTGRKGRLHPRFGHRLAGVSFYYPLVRALCRSHRSGSVAPAL